MLLMAETLISMETIFLLKNFCSSMAKLIVTNAIKQCRSRKSLVINQIKVKYSHLL
jgi:hypothetical protein